MRPLFSPFCDTVYPFQGSTTLNSRLTTVSNGPTVMTDSDGSNLLRDGTFVMKTASGSKSLASRLEQALLTEGSATEEQLFVVHMYTTARVDAVSISFRQAAIATPALDCAATFEKHWDARL